ncbi:hypothetical protein [Streptosporangium sp. OZ121]|uniref:hypothetical protein n=1 Tax=Streptosporangium sp. OZ121 TaxID=3444183 RepID=UPI003F7AEA83
MSGKYLTEPHGRHDLITEMPRVSAGSDFEAVHRDVCFALLDVLAQDADRCAAHRPGEVRARNLRPSGRSGCQSQIIAVLDDINANKIEVY